MKRSGWALLAVLMALVLVGGPLVVVLSDWLWYGSIGYLAVYTTELATRVGVGCVFGLVMFSALLANLAVLRRVRPRDGVWVGRNLFELHRNPMVERYADRILVVASAVVAVLSGLEAAGHWRAWLLFVHGAPFGRTDPVFGHDYGFYVFRLPFVDYALGWIMFVVVLSLMVSVVMDLFHRAIVVMPGRLYVEPPARKHLLTLVSLLMVMLATRFWLAGYGLLDRQGPLMTGAAYTDVHAVLPMLQVLCGLSLVAAVLVGINAVAGGFRLTAFSVLALLVVDLVGMQLFPGLMQRLTVAPNELDKERPYLQHNIAATRYAYGLDRVHYSDFAVAENLTADSISKNRSTVESIRLWDRAPLLQACDGLQTLRPYYDFVDADNDRYQIEGRLLQVSLSARELVSSNLPARNWINENLTYTHGFGLCAGPVTRFTSDGLPEFFVKDIPPASTVSTLEVTEPRIYFGEKTESYAIVGTKCQEFDYPSGSENVYIGQGGGPTDPPSTGVVLDSFVKKFLFFLRFAEPKVLLSSDITRTSRVLFHRTVRERAARVTPWVIYDVDPYVVVSKGRLYWMIDGYTCASDVPYAQTVRFRDRTPINYIRNSVKTVIDAHDGTVKVYVSEPDDAVVRSYSRIFPGVYRPLAEMDEDLRRHIRYPEEMFAMQADVLGTYHMDDPQVFYNKEDLWRLPDRESGRMSPYYTILRFPRGEREEFILMTPFTPPTKQNMIAWMAARCDVPHYGELQVYRFPKKKLVYGPAQIDALINQDSTISSQVTLWNQQGSSVRWGSLLVIPIEESLIYVKPLYIESRSTDSSARALPQLKRVIVSYGNRVAMTETLDQALATVFKGGAPVATGTIPTTPLPPPGAVPSPSPGAAPSPAPSGQASPQPLASASPGAPGAPGAAPTRWQVLAKQAREQMDRAEAFQRAGDWAAYGEELKKLRATLQEMETLSATTSQERPR